MQHHIGQWLNVEIHCTFCFMHLHILLHAFAHSASCICTFCFMHLHILLHAFAHSASCICTFCFMHLHILLHAFAHSASCICTFCFMHLHILFHAFAHSASCICTFCFMHLHILFHAVAHSASCICTFCFMHLHILFHAFAHSASCICTFCFMHLHILLHAFAHSASCICTFCFMHLHILLPAFALLLHAFIILFRDCVSCEYVGGMRAGLERCAALLSPCGTLVFAGITNGAVHVWSTDTGKSSAKTSVTPFRPVHTGALKRAQDGFTPQHLFLPLLGGGARVSKKVVLRCKPVWSHLHCASLDKLLICAINRES